MTSVVAPLARRPFSVTVQSRPDLARTAYVPRRMRGISRRALVSTDQAVCVAGGMVPALLGLGLPEGRARVVTNGVDVDAVQLAARAPSPLGDVDGPVQVGTGRLAHQKGFDLLVRAHALALASGAPAHTVVVLGDGPDRARLQQLAQELGVQDSVRFPGHVANPHAVVARADGFVLPSRWEGLPLALLEALCCGTPCIAADCVSGPNEVLDGGAFGRLVPVEDAQALAAAISDHLSDVEPLTARARAGRAAAPDRFAAAVAARDHLHVLQELVRPSGAHSRRRLSPSRSADSTQSSVHRTLSLVGNWSSPPPKNQAENT